MRQIPPLALLLVAALLAGAAAPAARMSSATVTAKAKTALEDVFKQRSLAGNEEIKKTPNSEFRRFPWQVNLSPIFPAAWPPEGKSVIYGYARAFDTGLHDAERVGNIWAEARLSGEAVKIEAVHAAIEDLGPQGFRPIGRDDPVIALNEIAQDRLLAAKSEKDFDEDVRKFYCRWRRYNGVIAAKIEPLQQGFFGWLACK